MGRELRFWAFSAALVVVSSGVSTASGEVPATDSRWVDAGARSAALGTIVFDGETRGPTGFDDERAAIYTVRADGRRLRRLTPASELAFAPSWSPDGKRIAYISRRRGFDTPWVMNADGSQQRQLVPFALHHGIFNPSLKWSPDGTRLAFARDGRGSTKTTIWVVNADASRPRQVTAGDKIHLSPDNDYEPSWSPDGKWLTFVRRGRVWMVRPDGTGAHMITKRVWEADGQPSFSPDGKWIAYFGDDIVWVVRPDGSGKRELIGASRLSGLAWSPKDNRVALTICDDRLIPAVDCGSVAIIGVDGRKPQPLSPGGPNGHPAWSPDGRLIAFARQKALGSETLYVVSVDGAPPTKIADIDGDPEAIGWRST